MSDIKYKVLITTSGIGSRLGGLTKNTNKALVLIDDRTIIDHIIEKYSIDTTIVVTLGYLGQKVQAYLVKKYSGRNFEFVWVDKYDGPGSSLGYSLLQAKDKLQCPFIYQACDTIVLDKIPSPDKNWIGAYVTDWSKTDLLINQYRTHTVENNQITKLNEKGVSNFDSIHIGLDGIFDYKLFWQILENIYQADKTDMSLSEVHVLVKMLEQGSDFRWVPFSVWLDTGNISALENSKKLVSLRPL